MVFAVFGLNHTLVALIHQMLQDADEIAAQAEEKDAEIEALKAKLAQFEAAASAAVSAGD